MLLMHLVRFNQRCADRDSTDISEAWELFDHIKIELTTLRELCGKEYRIGEYLARQLSVCLVNCAKLSIENAELKRLLQ